MEWTEEGIVLAAVGAYFASRGDELAVAAVVIAVLGSLMVSYTRARAEALGVECKVGLATRPVRVVILSVGLVFAKGAGLGEILDPPGAGPGGPPACVRPPARRPAWARGFLPFHHLTPLT